jgi:DNA-binding SARP family transcriptional activator
MIELDFCLLGRFSASLDGTAVEEQRWVRKKARLLVKLLALAPNRKMHWEQLIDVLWPDADPELALNNLHKVIQLARRALEPDLVQGASRFIVTQDLQVGLAGSDVRIDFLEFERLAAEALRLADTLALETAVELYRGDLLEEDSMRIGRPFHERDCD